MRLFGWFSNAFIFLFTLCCAPLKCELTSKIWKDLVMKYVYVNINGISNLVCITIMPSSFIICLYTKIWWKSSIQKSKWNVAPVYFCFPSVYIRFFFVFSRIGLHEIVVIKSPYKNRFMLWYSFICPMIRQFDMFISLLFLMDADNVFKP